MLLARLLKKDSRALADMFEAAETCCGWLQEAADRDTKFVTQFAKHQCFWPAMLAQKPLYHKIAANQLKRIRVGTKSIPLTTPKTNIELTNIWTSLATPLLERILIYRGMLERKKAGIRTGGPRWQEIENMDRITEANEYPEVLNLPDQFDRDSKAAYWKVAKRMLENDWKRDPAAEDAASKAAEKSKFEQGRRYAIRKIMNAFYSLAR